MMVLEPLCQGGAKHGIRRSAQVHASGGSLNLDRTLKL